MKNINFLLVFSALVLVSCGTNTPNGQDLLTEIEQKEKAIKQISIDLRPGQMIPMSESDELVELLLDYYRSHPESVKAPACLDKVHMIYSSTKRYSLSVSFGDTLLVQYPKYINRAMIIESMAVTYDLFIQPRNKQKIRYYNELLLEENPDLSSEKREGIEFKLKNLDLSMDEIIRKSIEEE